MPNDGMNEAAFTEVLEIQVNTESFKAGLQEMESLYNDFIERVGEDKAQTMLNVGGFKGISEALDSLKGSFQEFDAASTTAMSDMASGIEVALNKIEAREAELAQARADRAAQRRRQQEQEAEGGSGALAGLAEEAGYLLKIAALWEVIGLVIEGVTKVIKAPFDALGEGLDYLNKLQQKTDEIRGVLLDNVKFSADWNENLKMVDEASGNIVKQFQDIAAADHLNPEHLINSFKALVESGGANYVTNTQQLVQLTEDFNLAMKNSGVSAQTTRRLISEIPQALEGTLPASSKFLEVLHLTQTQWVAIRDRAKEHRDLLAELEPFLAPYLTATQQMAMHHEQLVEQLELYKQRWEALAAEPVYNWINDALSETLKWLEANKGVVNDFAKFLGDAATQALSLGKAIFTSFGESGPLKGFLKDLGNTAILIADIVDTLSRGVAIVQWVTHNKSTDDMVKFDGEYEQRQKQRDRMHVAINQGMAAAYGNEPAENKPKVLDGGMSQRMQNILGMAPTDVMGNIIEPLHPLTTNDKGDGLSDLRAKMAEALNDAKTKASEAMSNVQMLETTSQISTEEAYKRRITILDVEQGKVNDTIKQYIHLAEISGGKPQAIEKFKSSAEKTGHNDVNAIDLQKSRASDRLDTSEYTAQKQQMQDELKLAQEVSKQKIELAKLSGTSAVEVSHLEAAAEQDTYEKRRQILGDEMSRVDQNSTYYKHLEREMADLTVAHLYQIQIDSKKTADARVADELRVSKEAMASQMAALHEKEEEAALLGKINTSTETLWKNNKALAAEYLHIVDTTLLSLKAQLAKAQANGVETAATQKLRQEISALTAERAKADAAVKRTSQVPGIGSITNHDNAVKTAKDTVADKQQNYDKALADFAAGLFTGVGDLSKLSQALKDAGEELDMAKQAAADLAGSFSDVGEKLADAVLGSGFMQKMQSADGVFDKFKVGIDGAVNAISSISGAIDQYKQGAKKGGALGGVGSLLSTGPISDALSAIPYVGAFVKPIGAIMSFIGGMFTKAAQQIADKIQKAFDTTMKNYQNGDATLTQTLTQVEKERTDAINQLSGKKGGKDQLDKLLPELDNEIAQLKKQQKDLLANFETQLKYLQLQSETLSGLAQQWDSINKSIKDYLDAGGSATNALLYAQLSLAQMQKQTTDSLNQGQQTAIQDAIQLNDLLQQRVDLEKQYLQQVFDLTNADSVERRGTGAVTRGQQVAQTTADYQKQLDALNEQIGLTTQKVTMESQLFTIATDINALHRQDDALTLLALDQQLQKYKDMQTFLSGSLVTNSNGSYGVQFGNGQNFNVQTLQINVNGGTGSPQDVADAVSKEVMRLRRLGLYDTY